MRTVASSRGDTIPGRYGDVYDTAALTEDNELTIEMTADVRAENSKQLFAALLRHAAGNSPTFLAVEDAQWLDSGSWALLLEVIRVVHPLLVVLTTRPLGEPVFYRRDCVLRALSVGIRFEDACRRGV